MGIKVKVAKLSDAVMGELKKYNSEVMVAVNKAGAKAAEMGAGLLRGSSPRRTGKYAKGWSVRQEPRRYGTLYVVHNKTNWQLTHLLEHGHAKRGGGRVQGHPHVAPAEQQVVAAFVADVEEAMKV